MPLYVADYLADAAHLSTIEHGAYLLLIMTYWQRGKALPDDDKKLATIVRVSPEEWAGMRETLAEFFECDGSLWRHGRIERELDKIRTKSEQARSAGKASAKRRGNTRPTDVEQSPNHTDTDTDTDSSETVSEPSSICAPQASRSVSRGTRLPDDWVPKPNILEMARNLGFSDQQYADHLDRFRDYWRSVPGAKGRKLDWDATWRNRVKELADRIRLKNGSPPQQNTIAAGVSRVRDAINRATSSDRRSRENPEPVSGLLESSGYVHPRTN